jgi:SAM-dependent methyltransferase
MESRELGLVLGQQLLGTEELHYGLWDDDLPPKLSNFATAQRRYMEFLVSAVKGAAPPQSRVLDVGCGTGGLLVELRRLGYDAEGVSPAQWLTRVSRERLARAGHPGTRIFECRFEEFPCAELAGKILRPGGHIVICDFFKTPVPEESGALGGGHPIDAFHQTIARSRFEIVRDEDITARIAPTMAIVDDMLMRRLLPACETLAGHFEDRRPLLFRALRFLARRKLEKVKRKYFSGNRTPEMFARHKTYRLFVLRLRAG